MKIIHIVEPFASGVAVFVRSLVENLHSDHHVIIHGERASVSKAEEVKALFQSSNVEFVKWKFAQRSLNPFLDGLAFLNLVYHLKRNSDADAVHLHSSKSGFLGRIACRILGINNVIYTPNGAPFVGGNKFNNFLFKKLEQIGASFGGKIICCSQSEQNAYKKIGIKAGCIKNGTALKFSEYCAKPIGKEFVVVNSGRIEAQKNPKLFNEIAEYFVDLPEFKFIWIGDGKLKKVLTSPNIEVTGWLPEAEGLKIINDSDLFLSTSSFEGLSFSIMEAMWRNKPLLLTDCVGNMDMVKHRSNGDLYNSASEAILKISEYYTNSEMLNIMGQNSQEICEKEFNVDKNFLNYRRFYGNFAFQ